MRPNPFIDEVYKLHYHDRLSVRAIARKTGLARNTIKNMLKPSQIKPAKPAQKQNSIIDPFAETIRTMLQDSPTLKAATIFERLRSLGYDGGISTLRNFVAHYRPKKTPQHFLTLHFSPGEAMQVDWADFGYIIPGIPRKVSCLVMVLCYSRLLYIEFTLSQKMGTFLRAFDRGLLFFGGTTEVDIFDNMKTVVLHHHKNQIQFNPKFYQFAQARGFSIAACNSYSPHEKGRVERPISFVRSRFFAGRRFASLLDINTQASAWRDGFANTRIHEATNKVPAFVFANEEKPKLLPLLNQPFDTDDVESATVTKLFRVSFDRNQYSVPPHLVGQKVLLRAKDQLLQVYFGPKLVASHERSYSFHQNIEDPTHRVTAITSKPRVGLPEPLDQLGPSTVEYFKTISASSRSLRKEINQISLFCEMYGIDATAKAVAEVVKSGHAGREYVEHLLKLQNCVQRQAHQLHFADPQINTLALSSPNLELYDQIIAPRKTLVPDATENPHG